MQTFNLDLSIKEMQPRLNAKQGEVGRTFLAVITDGSTGYEIPEGAKFSVWYSGAGGDGNYTDIGDRSAFGIDGNTVTVELITQMLNLPGKGELCLTMEIDGYNTSTWNIPYLVEAVPGMGSKEATQYFNIQKESAERAAASAKAAADSAAAAQQAAEKLETDESLSLPGVAADAKITGERIAMVEGKAADLAQEVLKNSAKIGAVSIVCDTEGEQITLSDASNRELQGLTIYGKTTQYALFAMTCHANATATNAMLVSASDLRILKKGNVYTISVDLTATAETYAYWLAEVQPDGEPFPVEIIPFELIPVKAGTQRYSYTFTAASDGVLFDEEIAVLAKQQGDGNTITASNVRFEYGKTNPNSTPTPDAPIALVSAGDGGNIEVAVYGENLAVPSDIVTQNEPERATVTSEGNVITLATDPLQNSGESFFFCIGLLQQGKTYTISGNAVGYGNLRIYDMSDLNSGFKGYANTDENGNFSLEYTPAANNHAFRIWVNKGTPCVLTDFSIALKSSENSYKLPTKQAITIPTPNGLPGIPVDSGGNYTDENGQQWLCDEIDFTRGVYVQRIFTEEVAAACINMVSAYNSAGYYWFRITTQKNGVTHGLHCKTTHFTVLNEWQKDDEYAYVTKNFTAYIFTNRWTTKEEFAAWLEEQAAAGTPFTIMYQIDEPEETTLSEKELAAYAALHTNKPNTTIYNDAGADMKVSYVADPKIYIDNKFNELAAAIVNNT